MIGRALEHIAFAEIVRGSTMMLPPLRPEEIEAAIVTPAALAGVSVEPGLVAELVDELSGRPGALPMLQLALAELFERRRFGVMTIETYRSLGGASGAMARRAEEAVLDALPEGHKPDVVRRLFERLVVVGEEGEVARRRVERSELPSDESTSRLIERLTAARLLSVDRAAVSQAPTVEITHEAIIREWPRLAAWVAADRDGWRRRHALTSAVAGWDAHGRDNSDLYRGIRLSDLLGWIDGRAGLLNAAEAEFVDASIRQREREAAEADAAELSRRS